MIRRTLTASGPTGGSRQWGPRLVVAEKELALARLKGAGTWKWEKGDETAAYTLTYEH